MPRKINSKYNSSPLTGESVDALRRMVGDLERQLAEAKILSNVIAEQIPVSLFILNLDSRFTYVSDSFAQSLGLKAKEVIGKLDSEVLDSARLLSIRNGFRAATLSSGTVCLGSSLTVAPLKDRDGRIRGVIGVEVHGDHPETDKEPYQAPVDGVISGHSEGLRAPNMISGEVESFLHIGTFQFLLPDREYLLSDGAIDIANLPRVYRVPEEQVLSIIHPDDRADVRRWSDEAARDRGVRNRRLRLLLQDGTVKFLEVRSHTEFAEGVPRRVLGTVADITDQIERDRARAEIERLLNDTQAEAQIGSWVYIPETDSVALTVEARRICDIDTATEHVPLRVLVARVNAESQGHLIKALQAGHISDGPHQTTAQFMTNAGEMRHVVITVRSDRTHETRRVWGTIRDTTTEVGLSEQLTATRRRLAEAELIARSAEFQWDTSTGALTCDQAFADVLGLPLSDKVEQIGPALSNMEPLSIRELTSGFVSRAVELGEAEAETTSRDVDGRTRYVRWRVTSVSDNGSSQILYGTVRDVSATRVAEIESLLNRNMLLESHALAKITAWHYDPETDVITMTPEGYRIREIGEEQKITRQAFLTAVCPDDIPAIEAYWKGVRDTGMGETEYRLLLPGGAMKWMHVRAWRREGVENENEIFGLTQDITERKNAEISLRESERHLLEAQAIAEVGSWSYSLKERKYEISPQCCAIYELEPSMLPATRETVLERIHPEDRATLTAYWKRSESGQQATTELRLLFPDGRIKFLHTNSIPQFSGRELVGFSGTVQDVTAIKEAQFAIQERDRMLLEAQSLAKIASCRFYPDTGIYEVSPTFYVITGLSHMNRTITEDNMMDLILNTDYEAAYRPTIDRTYLVGHGQCEVRIQHASGDIRYLRMLSRMVEMDDPGRGHICTFQDITEQKTAEMRLVESEKQLLDSQRMARLASWRWDIAKDLYTATEEAYEIYGFPLGQPISRQNVLDRVHPDDRTLSEEEWPVDESSGLRVRQFRLLFPDGQIKYVRVSVRVILSGNTIVGFEGTSQDVTDLVLTAKKAEESQQLLLHAQELARIGTYKYYPREDRFEGSTQFYSILGLPNDQVVTYADVASRMHEGDRMRLRSLMKEALEREGSCQIDGRTVDLKYISSVAALVDPADARAGYYGVIMDVTSLKDAQIQTDRNNKMLKVLLECSRLFVHAKDDGHLLRYVCKALAKNEQGFAWVGKRVDGRQGYETTSYEGPSEAKAAVIACGVKLSISRTTILKPEVVGVEGVNCAFAIPINMGGNTEYLLLVGGCTSEEANEVERRHFEQLGDELGFAIEAIRNRKALARSLAEAEKQTEQVQNLMEAVVRSLAATLELRDPYTSGHQDNVSQLAVAIARSMGLAESTVAGIRVAALVHDIGKIQVPIDILSKPTKLTDIEYAIIKTHPGASYEVLKDLPFPWPVAEIVRQHHERMDGSGYPFGKRGEEILLESRIVAVADIVDAMTSHRPYRPAPGVERAMALIKEQRGKQLDAAVVDACIDLFQSGSFVPKGETTQAGDALHVP